MPKVIDLPTSTSMSNSDYLIMEASGGGTKKITKQNIFGGATGTLNVLQNYYVYPEITLGGTSGTTAVTLNFRRSSNYHSAIILGAVGGVGSIVLGCTMNDGQVTVKNLMTGGGDWASQNLQITASGSSMTISSSYKYASYITVVAG